MLIHLGLGVVFVHSFLGGMATFTGSSQHAATTRTRKLATLAVASVAWLTVISGTWMVYDGYRATPPPGAGTTAYPKADLLADPATAVWHTFAMEWKEHIGWLAPFLATAVAFVVLRHRQLLDESPALRRMVSNLFALAFFAAMVASVLGAMINKVAPNQFLKL